MKNIAHILAVPVLMFLLAMGPDAALAQARLLGITHSSPTPGVEQISLQLDGPSRVNDFTLDGRPARVIFDFPGMTHSRDVKSITRINSPLIEQVRVGRHEGAAAKTRVVFDLKTLKGVHYTSSFDQANSSLIIRFTGPGAAATPKTTAAATPKTAVKAPAAATTAPEQATPPATRKPPQPDKKPTPAEPRQKEKAPASAPAGKTSPPAQPVSDKPALKPAAQPAQPAAPQVAAEKPAAEEKKEPATAPQPAPAAAADKAAAEASPRLESIAFDPDSSKGEMVLFRLNGFHPPAIHGVEEGVPRVICDFTDTSAADQLRRTIKANGQHVKMIRTTITSKPKKIRTVIDLEPNRSYDLQQVFFKDENLFVLIVNTTR
ncbi:MAG: AMIN domain-containing protein [Desulfobulbus sp.]|jgi:hypothetical protein